jgi:transketolase
MLSLSQKTQKLEFGPRRSVYITNEALEAPAGADSLLKSLEDLDLIYRTLCGLLYNFVPTSGHPGGSISSGRIVEGLLYNTMNYNLGNPDEPGADILSYSAGHKAMGLYSMWALRDEIFRQYDEKLLPTDVRKRLRLEDLLGFRRNTTQSTPLFKKHHAKPLDGHPSPATPFVRLSTGASGVGVGSSFGLGIAARDLYGTNAPFVHVLEGEGGLTPGRAHEALAAVATGQVNNVILHVDWNQASIDSDRVCREGENPGDYVQWNPIEFAYLHDWNVIFVKDGFDFRQILAAQKLATSQMNEQPTCIVYRTIKGWQYGIEGKGSHGAGHKFCSPEFYEYLKAFENRFGVQFPRFNNESTEEAKEELYYKNLMVIREVLQKNPDLVKTLGAQLARASENLKDKNRKPREGAPDVDKLYNQNPEKIPENVIAATGKNDTLRDALGRTLSYLNKDSKGAILATAADLSGSTSIKKANEGFADGFWNAQSNPNSRFISTGGICEDGAGAIMSGVSAYGASIGVTSSYGAFIAALQHIAARLHSIGQQGRHDYNDSRRNPFIISCAHAGLKTGEDGPTHADPQPLQLLQENFPEGSMITLTPWCPNELWPLMTAALKLRPAVIAPFVTRPSEKVLDREKLGIPPASAAAKGVYALRRADDKKKEYHGTVVLQGSGEMYAFMEYVLPKIDEAKLNMNIYYVASAELFNLLPKAEQENIFPQALRNEAMGITGFTLPTLYRWVQSSEGLQHSLHPFAGGRFPASGQAHKVLEEAKLDGPAQWEAIKRYAEEINKKHK